MSRIVLVLALLAAGAVGAKDQHGRSVRGASLLRVKVCPSCHAVFGRGGGQASDLTAHGGAARHGARGLEQPELSSQDIRDAFQIGR